MGSSRSFAARRAHPPSPPRSNWCAKEGSNSGRTRPSRRCGCARSPPQAKRAKTPMMGNVAKLFETDAPPRFAPEDLRIAEAMVFAAAEPIDETAIAARLSQGAEVGAVMAELQRDYRERGVNLVRVAGRWSFRTAPDLGWLLAREEQD